MLLYDDVRTMLQDHVRLGRVDDDKLLELLYDCMGLYERAGDSLPKDKGIGEIVELLKHEESVSQCLSEEVDELTEKLETAEYTITELRRQLNEMSEEP